MIGGTLETHTAEEGDQAKRGTAVDGLGIRSLLYIYIMICKGSFHLRFSGIRPLRGGGTPLFR